MPHPQQVGSIILTILAEQHSKKSGRKDDHESLIDYLTGNHSRLSSRSHESHDSEIYTTQNTYHSQTSTSLSGGGESEGMYIYLSKERDIYHPPLTLSPDSHLPPERNATCGHLKNATRYDLAAIVPMPMTQEELDALLAQADLDNQADAQALWQFQEAKRLARERALAFIAAHRQAHTIPSVAIFTNKPRTNLVQYESQECRMVADTSTICWLAAMALDSVSQATIQASG